MLLYQLLLALCSVVVLVFVSYNLIRFSLVNSTSVKSVKFYMYPPEEIELYTDCDKEHDQGITGTYKHSADLFLVDALRQHRWMSTPEEADIFVVPALFNQLSRGQCKNPEEFESQVERLVQYLSRSKWFQRSGGSDHFLVASDNPDRIAPVSKIRREWFDKNGTLGKVILGRYIVKQPEEFLPRWPYIKIGHTTFYSAFRAPYTSNTTLQVHKKWRDWRDRDIIVSFTGRIVLGSRMRLFRTKRSQKFDFPVWITTRPTRSSKKAPSKVPNCTSKYSQFETIEEWFRQDSSDQQDLPFYPDRCSGSISFLAAARILERTKYCLLLSGGVAGSDRFEMAFSAGAVIAHVGLLSSVLPYPNLIPWEKLLIYIPKDDFDKDPMAIIRKLNEIPDEIGHQIFQLQQNFIADLEFSDLNSRVADNILIEAMIAKNTNRILAMIRYAFPSLFGDPIYPARMTIRL
eukprot:Lithocolla_globosa_v1_NODE_2772_length_1873_cov_3.993949.p1 type:complete len:460 gc:universal NODE_2772_length_1873_cov_3.993949:1565-186(-)